jgi:multidrug efflux system membrane fusion protein
MQANLRQPVFYSAAVLLGLALFISIRAVSKSPDIPEESSGAVNVTVSQVVAYNHRARVRATGKLSLKHESNISFKIAGVLAELPVRSGDIIKKGDLLARLDQTEISAREREALAQLGIAKKELERVSALQEKGFAPIRLLDDAQAKVTRAQSALEVVQFDRKWSELRAPWDGVVLNRFAEAGELMSPGRSVLSVGDTTSGLLLTVPLSDRDIARVKTGNQVDIGFAVLKGKVSAQVTRIAAAADARTGSFEAEIALLEIHDQLRSGMFGDAEIIVEEDSNGGFVAIPADAFVEGNGDLAGVFVLRPDGKSAAFRSIVVDRLEVGQAVVSKGLNAGERVVDGVAYLRDGQSVKVVAAQLFGNRPIPHALSFTAMQKFSVFFVKQWQFTLVLFAMLIALGFYFRYGRFRGRKIRSFRCP